MLPSFEHCKTENRISTKKTKKIKARLRTLYNNDVASFQQMFNKVWHAIIIELTI